MVKIKLRKSLLKNILIPSLTSFIALFILFNLLFNYSFNSYLEKTRMKRFEELKVNISHIISNQDLESLADSISLFAYMEDVEIEILSSKGESLGIFNPLDATSNEPLVKNSYEILNGQKLVGSLVVSYLDKSNISDFARSFQNKLTAMFFILLVFTVCASVFSSYYLSRETSKQIEGLSKMALDFKNKDYLVNETMESNIEEIQDLYDNMIFLGKSLAEQEGIRKKYSQDISHELRTPLTNLLLYIEAIKDGVLELDEDSFESIQEEIYHMNSLVDKLRRGFNENAAIIDKDLESFDLTKHLRGISKKLSGKIRANGISFTLKVQENVWVHQDKEKISQIIYNILSNAIKACDKEDSIKLFMKEKDGQISISIRDSGIGIKEEDLDKIFQRNFRSDTERNKKIPGQGLGLAISMDLLKSIGGTIDVKSKIGSGSNFTIHFPKTL